MLARGQCADGITQNGGEDYTTGCEDESPRPASLAPAASLDARQRAEQAAPALPPRRCDSRKSSPSCETSWHRAEHDGINQTSVGCRVELIDERGRCDLSEPDSHFDSRPLISHEIFAV